MASNDNISIRTRIRKASTSINPEFGPSIESLLTFVSSTQSSSWKKNQRDGNSSIVITPLSILSGSTHPASAAGGGGVAAGGGAWRSASPQRSQSAPRGRLLSSSHRNHSFNNNNNNSGHPPLLVRGGPSNHSATSVLSSSSVGRRSSSVTAAAAALAAAAGVAGGGGNKNRSGGEVTTEGGTNRLEFDLMSNDGVEGGMVDVSLEDNNKPDHNDGTIRGGSGITMELETELSSSKDDKTRRQDNKEVHHLLLPPMQQQSQQLRHRSPSPLPIVRSGSGLSVPSMGVSGGSQQQQQDQQQQQHNRSSNNSIVSSTGSSNNSRARSRSINARSRSINKNRRARSHSRGGGGGESLTSSGRCGAGALSRGGALSLSGRRMRSAGAANVFNTSTVVYDDNDSMTDHSFLHNHEEEVMMETMNVLLKDIISVRHETPSSAAELHAPVTVGRVASFTPPTAPQPLYRPGSKLSTTSQSLSPSLHSGLNCYRIYIHTRTSEYLEFNFDNNSNSYDVVLAYLRCHLKDGMVPPDDVPVGSDGVGSAASKLSSLGKPVNFTRTKSLSSKVASKGNGGGGDGDDDATVTSSSASSTGNKQHQPPSSSFQPFISQSNSSNPIERLQTKAINRQLQQEHTPMNSIKENVAEWVSSIIDCANFGCCQDTVTPEDKSLYNGNGIEGTPLRQSQSQQQRDRSTTPRSKMLKRNGIGGLSFEVETVSSNRS